uniref:Uncharacterized protein n=1 Tax=Schistocephalus solidus TaxID=70667 RepID=A0A0X3PBJ3_SCHSO
MRERLVLLKEELKRRQSQHNEQQQNWPNKARGLVRRRSSNPRSASIRRSSMREKAKLSWKEARLEAETCSLVVSTEDGACVQEEAKAPVWMTSATVDGTDSQRKSNGEQHSVAAVTDGTVKNNSHVRGSSGRLSTSRSHQQPPSNHSPSRGGGTGRASEAQRPISPSETSPNTSSKKPRTGSRPTVVEGAAAQPLPERPTPSCPSRSRSPPSASWNGSVCCLFPGVFRPYNFAYSIASLRLCSDCPPNLHFRQAQSPSGLTAISLRVCRLQVNSAEMDPNYFALFLPKGIKLCVHRQL